MNLTKLFDAQKKLREHINYNGEDRFEKLILALLVEIGECANEWRGFKFWSKNQEPRKIFHTTAGATPNNAVYFKCQDEDRCGENLTKEDFNNLLGEPDYEQCPKCIDGYVYPFREKNSLLEEYVDGLHFVLEIGIELGYEDKTTIWRIPETDGTEGFSSVFRSIVMLEIHRGIMEYQRLLSVYYRLGNTLGFTVEQIEQAYFDKNQINHSRQENGY